jgi:hypothetical protein
MKGHSIKFFLQEDILTLFLSILLWVMSLLCIYLFADMFITDEESFKITRDNKIPRYYEEIVPSNR